MVGKKGHSYRSLPLEATWLRSPRRAWATYERKRELVIWVPSRNRPTLVAPPRSATDASHTGRYIRDPDSRSSVHPHRRSSQVTFSTSVYVVMFPHRSSVLAMCSQHIRSQRVGPTSTAMAVSTPGSGT